MTPREIRDSLRQELIDDGQLPKDLDDYIRAVVAAEVQQAFDDFDLREALYLLDL